MGKPLDGHSHDHEHEHHHDPQEAEQAKAQLSRVLNRLPHRVDLVLATGPGGSDALSTATRQAVRSIRELTDKIGFEEYELGHEKLAGYDVKTYPSLLFQPDEYKIRLLGPPMGEEGLTFVEALLMLGHRRTDASEQSLKVLQSLEEPRQIQIFVSTTCPYCPPQAVNAIKAAVERPDLVSLEIIDIQAQPEMAEEYQAYSTPTTFANGKLIAKGAQPEELFMASLLKLEQQTIFIPDETAEEIDCDVVIVGGGPAGLTAGIYTARSGLKAVVVEKGALGGQVATTPTVENYPGLTQVGGKSLVDIMVAHALQYSRIFPGEEVVDIQAGQRFIVTTTRRRFLCRAVLLATGARYRKLGAAGEDSLAGRGVSYCSTCDGPLFKGKKVLIVGGGDSAVTEALHLANIGVEVVLAHRGEKLRAQASLAGRLKEAGVSVLYNTELKEIQGLEKVTGVKLFNNATNKTTEMDLAGVFIAIGYQPAVELAAKLNLELTAQGYIKKDEHHRTSQPGIYSAGDVEGGYKQIVTAAGQGAEAALSIFEDLMDPYWLKRREGKAS